MKNTAKSSFRKRFFTLHDPAHLSHLKMGIKGQEDCSEKDTIINLNFILPSCQSIIDNTMQFSESWERCHSHPHNKILILESIFYLPNGLRPSWWLSKLLQLCCQIFATIIEFAFSVTFPCNIFVTQRDSYSGTGT